MAMISKILFNGFVTSSVAQVYSPGAGKQARISKIFALNPTTATHQFSLCIDDDGSGYSSANARIWQKSYSSGAEATISFNDGGLLPLSGKGSIGAGSTGSNQINLLIVGEETLL